MRKEASDMAKIGPHFEFSQLRHILEYGFEAPDRGLEALLHFSIGCKACCRCRDLWQGRGAPSNEGGPNSCLFEHRNKGANARSLILRSQEASALAPVLGRSERVSRRSTEPIRLTEHHLRHARAVFELMELLYINERFGEIEEHAEALAELLWAHEHVRDHFRGLRDELEMLSNSDAEEHICMDYVRPKLDVLYWLRAYSIKL